MKNPLDRQSGEVPSHTLDLSKLDYIFSYLLKGEGNHKLMSSSWQFSFVRAMHQTWKKGGVEALTEDSLVRLEKIYVRC